MSGACWGLWCSQHLRLVCLCTLHYSYELAPVLKSLCWLVFQLKGV